MTYSIMVSCLRKQMKHRLPVVSILATKYSVLRVHHTFGYVCSPPFKHFFEGYSKCVFMQNFEICGKHSNYVAKLINWSMMKLNNDE